MAHRRGLSGTPVQHERHVAEKIDFIQKSITVIRRDMTARKLYEMPRRFQILFWALGTLNAHLLETEGRSSYEKNAALETQLYTEAKNLAAQYSWQIPGGGSVSGFWSSVGGNAQRIFDMALAATTTNLAVAGRITEGFARKSLQLDGLGTLSSKSAFALYDRMRMRFTREVLPLLNNTGMPTFSAVDALIAEFKQYEQAFAGSHGGPRAAHGEAQDFVSKLLSLRGTLERYGEDRSALFGLGSAGSTRRKHSSRRAASAKNTGREAGKRHPRLKRMDSERVMFFKPGVLKPRRKGAKRRNYRGED